MTMRILIINPFGIGDVLFSTPLISSVKREYPQCYIGYICNKRTSQILETNPAIDEVFVFDRGDYRAFWKESKLACAKKFIGFWRKIASRKFDILIDLSLGKEYSFLCWLIGIKERRGFNYRGRGRFLTHKVPFEGFNDKPVAEYYLDLLLKDVIARPKAEALRLRSGFRPELLSKDETISTVLITTDEDRRYVDNFLKNSGIDSGDTLIGIAPGGGMSFGKKEQGRRRWPAARFSELADRVADSFKARIILIWGPGEEELVNEIKGLMKREALISPETNIRQMAALCKMCNLVICSEGGPLHIASSQGVKTVSIFGPVDEKVYGPYPPGKNNIVITSDVDCRPCYQRFKLPNCDTKKCLEGISVDTVFNAINFLEER